MFKCVYLHKREIIRWTKNRSALLVQSPYSTVGGIWWSKACYFPSQKYPNYFAIGIDFERDYQEYDYTDNGHFLKKNPIKGDFLYQQYEIYKNRNRITLHSKT